MSDLILKKYSCGAFDAEFRGPNYNLYRGNLDVKFTSHEDVLKLFY